MQIGSPCPGFADALTYVHWGLTTFLRADFGFDEDAWLDFIEKRYARWEEQEGCGVTHVRPRQDKKRPSRETK